MKNSDRRQKAKKSKRSAIVESARILFNAKGFAGTSVEAIADRAGLAKGTVYLYFPGKEALYEHLVESILEEAIRERSALVEKAADPLEALQGIWQSQVRSLSENPAFFGPRPAPMGPRVEALSRTHFDLIRSVFDRLRQAGRLRDIAPELAANLYLAALHGAFLFFRRADSEGAPPLFADRVFDVFLRGVLEH